VSCGCRAPDAPRSLLARALACAGVRWPFLFSSAELTALPLRDGPAHVRRQQQTQKLWFSPGIQDQLNRNVRIGQVVSAGGGACGWRACVLVRVALVGACGRALVFALVLDLGQRVHALDGQVDHVMGTPSNCARAARFQAMSPRLRGLIDAGLDAQARMVHLDEFHDNEVKMAARCFPSSLRTLVVCCTAARARAEEGRI